MIVLSGNNGLELAILDVCNSEALLDAWVWVSEVSVGDLELVAEVLNLGGDVGSSVESSQHVVCGWVGVESLVLRNGH